MVENIPLILDHRFDLQLLSRFPTAAKHWKYLPLDAL